MSLESRPTAIYSLQDYVTAAQRCGTRLSAGYCKRALMLGGDREFCNPRKNGAVDSLSNDGSRRHSRSQAARARHHPVATRSVAELGKSLFARPSSFSKHIITEQDTKFTVPGWPRIRLDVMLAAKQNSDWHGRPR
jgi:hypothetical protein